MAFTFIGERKFKRQTQFELSGIKTPTLTKKGRV